MKITLAALGSADKEGITGRAAQALEKADLIIGADRLINAIETDAEKITAVRSEDIVNIVSGCERGNICVVFSGDTGFYSGAAALGAKLTELGLEYELIPGLSSVQLMAAAMKEPWQDWNLVSAHGRGCDAVDAVCRGKDTFFLTSGADSAVQICRELCAAGLGALEVCVGENLGTERERLLRGTAQEISRAPLAPLNVLLVRAAPLYPARAAGIADAEFIRAEVPMTKQELRAAILAKLEIRPEDVCWDVGAGTGSVSVELALAAKRVYAVEEKTEACELIRKNREKFCAWRMNVIEGRAPEALSALPAPSAVFVGGSGGELENIIAIAVEKNPAVRVCVSAIALETLSRAMNVMEKLALEYEITQISVSRARSAGQLHLLFAQNPVFLITGKRA